MPGLVALAAMFALAACGGGGGGSGSSNQAPNASFTANPVSGAAPLMVIVNASASSDPDGTISSYSWNFGDNSSGSGASTTHNYTVAGTYTITLTVRDNGGKTDTAQQSVSVTAGPPPTSVIVSGRVRYDRVPFKAAAGGGLDYARTTLTPARNIVVELIKTSDQSLLFTTSTDANGNYSFATAPVNTDVKVRARAQTRSTSGATWNIQVKNNTNSNALYVLDSSSFNTGVANQSKNLDADSGWPGANGTSYIPGDPRAAAPFAILDSLYSALQFVVTQGGDASISLPDLDVYWSKSNQASDTFAPATGNIQTTQYRNEPVTGGIYVLGKENVDTDEYDDHVLTHEFQHYLQDVTSRDDTVGGPHSFGEKLDMRVAFSEGYANAFSGMALEDPVYRDSSGASQGGDGGFNLETTAVSPLGWYNESTIAALAWDLFDTAADANDGVALPYSSIATSFRTTLRTGQPLTSIFPLVVALKTSEPASATAINTLVGSKGMVASTMNPFGATETNDAGNGDALPLYTAIIPNGGAVKVCGNRVAGIYNKVANRRFLTFSLAAALNATIHVAYTANGSDPPGGSTVTPDPDIVLYQAGEIARSESSAANQEDLVRALAAGDYVIEVYEYSHIEDPTSGTPRGRTCYNVTITG
jgi:PKD repeat protein